MDKTPINKKLIGQKNISDNNLNDNVDMKFITLDSDSDSDKILLNKKRESQSNCNSNNNNEKDKKKTNYRKNIPIEKKLKAIETAEKIGNRKTAKEYGVNENTIRKWRQNKVEFSHAKNKSTKITLHKGRALEPTIDWDYISLFIEHKKTLGLTVTSKDIFNEIRRKYPQLNKLNNHAISLRLNRFYKRKNYFFKEGKLIDKSLLSNKLDLIKNFLKEITEKRKNFAKNPTPLDLIINMDEVSITFNFFQKIDNKKGDNIISIKNFEQKKLRLTILVSITASGKKLPLFLIFKGRNKGLNFKELNNHPAINQGKAFIQCNENASCTKESMIEYHNKIFYPYLKKKLLSLNDKSLIIFDATPSHKIKEIIELFNSQNKQLAIIPQDLTSILQPVDICIKSLINNELQNKYTEYMSDDNNSNQTITRNLIIDWIIDIWYNENFITSKAIFNSFKEAGISNNLDGSEENLSKVFEKAKLLINKEKENDENDISFRDESEKDKNEDFIDLNKEYDIEIEE